MTVKSKFIKELSFHLSTLPEQESRKALFGYIEKFQIEMGKGKDSYSIVASWGNPKEAAEKIMKNYASVQESEQGSDGGDHLSKGIHRIIKFLYVKK